MELDHSARGTSTHIHLIVAILLRLINFNDDRPSSVTTNSIFLLYFVNRLLNFMPLIKKCLSSTLAIFVYLL